MSRIEKVYLISNGDARDAADVVCWPMQNETLKAVKKALETFGVESVILPEFNPQRGHGFLTKQCEGTSLFANIPVDAPVVVVLSCWAYSHHVSGALQTHNGPILLLGNFDGTWPGLVALLNHSGTLERLDVKHSRIWSETFDQDPRFMKQLDCWIRTGYIEHDTSHLTKASQLLIPDAAMQFGEELARDINRERFIIGQFDPGCMGMLNAVMSPSKLGQVGFPIEFLNQSDLLAEMDLVSDDEAYGCLNWLERRGTWFDWGDGSSDGKLTRAMVRSQMKMYIAAARIYDRFGLRAIGIPYQLGLVRQCPASDLAEGMLNNSERPDVKNPYTGQVINRGQPIVHFNEGDLGSGVPQSIMKEIYRRLGVPPETTLHDVRWGREWRDGSFVWVFLISGAAPPAHFGGWANTKVYRQPEMYFPLGGGTCSGVSKPGIITWARFYQSFGEIGMDCGLGEVVELPPDEVNDRLDKTTPVWPIMNVHIPGYGRDQLMATHKSNHITVGYGDILGELVATCGHLGIPTRVAGDVRERFS